MSKITPGSPKGNGANVVRNDVAAADSATINDTNFVPGDATAGVGWKSVRIFPRFTGGTTPNVTVQVLHRIASGWVVGDTTAPMTENQSVIVDLMGRDAYFRIHALGGGVAADSVDLYCAGWEPIDAAGMRVKFT